MFVIINIRFKENEKLKVAQKIRKFGKNRNYFFYRILNKTTSGASASINKHC